MYSIQEVFKRVTQYDGSTKAVSAGFSVVQESDGRKTSVYGPTTYSDAKARLTVLEGDDRPGGRESARDADRALDRALSRKSGRG